MASLLNGFRGKLSLSNFMTMVKKDLLRLKVKGGQGIIVQDTPTGQVISMQTVGGAIGGGETPVVSGGGPRTVFPAIIQSYDETTGIYRADIYTSDYDETPISYAEEVIPAVHTFSPIPAETKVLVYKMMVDTLEES